MTVLSVPDVCREVALACRVLGRQGHEDLVLGHVSARDPAGRGAWMKTSGMGLTETTAQDVALVGWDGSVIEGPDARPIEYPIHTELLGARQDVNAVVHTHPEHAVALGAAGEALRPVSHAATMFVPPALPRFEETSELITTPALGAAVAASLGDRHAGLLVNHGIVTTGADLPAAVVRAVMLERACRQQLLTRAFGSWGTWTPEAEAASKQAEVWPRRLIERIWDYLVRQA